MHYVDHRGIIVIGRKLHTRARHIDNKEGRERVSYTKPELRSRRELEVRDVTVDVRSSQRKAWL